jgi:hypothetical protein
MRSTSSPVSRAAAGVYAWLALQVVAMAALVVFEEARGHRLAQQIAAFGGNPEAPGARQVAGAVTVFAILMMALTIATLAAGAAYLTWLRRALPGTSRLGLVAAWLVPVVNLVAPLVLADRAWRDAGESGASRNGASRNGGGRNGIIWTDAGQRSGRPGQESRTRWLLLGACWWASWLVALFLVFVRPGHAGLTGAGLPQLGATIVAAILCAATVREITVLRETRHSPRSRDHQEFPELRERRLQARPPAHHSSYVFSSGSGSGSAEPAGRDRHRPGAGPELPELACQSRRWGSAGWPRIRPSRAPGVGPISE